MGSQAPRSETTETFAAAESWEEKSSQTDDKTSCEPRPAALPTTIDPLFAWALNGSPKRLWLIMFVVLIVGLSPWVPAAIEKVAINDSLKPDLLRDFGYWGMIVLSPPLIVFAVGLYLRQLPRTIRQLTKSGAVEIDESCYPSFADRYKAIIRGRWNVVLAFAVGLSAIPITFSLIIEQISGTWHFSIAQQEVSLTFIVSLLPTCLSYYIFATSVLHVLSVSRIIKELFSYKVNIHPLHPDQCGGLYPLGRMCSRMNLAVFAIGLICLIGILNNTYMLGIPLLSSNTYLILFVYVISAGIIFFLPLLPAHSAMSKAKLDITSNIHKHFLSIHRRLYDKLSRGEGLDREGTADLEHLQKMYDLAQSMPVYPFNAAIVRSFLLTVITPVILGVITQLVLDVIS